MKIAVTTEMEYMSNPQATRVLCNADYIEFVKAAGYTPYVVCEGMDALSIATQMDGLLLTGGKDISPLLFGKDLDYNGAVKCNLTRDLFEQNLYRAFVALGKPVYGICRGFQLLVLLSAAKEMGVSLHQNLDKVKEVTIQHNQNEVDIPGDNPVHIIEGRGIMKTLWGNGSKDKTVLIPVNSFHHQGFLMHSKTLDESWIRQNPDVHFWARSRETAFVLEAFGMVLHPQEDMNVMVGGVQYHPERMLRRGDVNSERNIQLFQYVMGTLKLEFIPEIPTLPKFKTLRNFHPSLNPHHTPSVTE